MHINSIHIKNYRHFNDFSMEFHKGLNVIIGANNAGKTGLLSAIKLLCYPSDISIDDFNKNNLLKYRELYKNNAPNIVIEYKIDHKISDSDTEDEAIIRLLPFLGTKEFSQRIKEDNESIEYEITAHIKATYSLDSKLTDEYRQKNSGIQTFDDYLFMLRRFVDKHYSWNYTNGISETKADQKSATKIFDLQFIGAERTSEEVRKGTKREIESFIKNSDNHSSFDEFQKDASNKLKELLQDPINELDMLFANEKNEIGLQKGNVSIASSVQANISFADTYTTEVRDTKGNYTLPLGHNGLGYNNLIHIYMLIKLNKIQQGKDFRILCLEEPEAHLHPAMQYKLFKYLKKLDKNDNLNQQIFVTTHSSNISAVAGIDNMFMFAYNRGGETPNCQYQSLLKQFKDQDNATNKTKAKAHLSKFLDVTRSDMLFADKVILVEGITEKLLMPLFMKKCGYPYEDEHISIVEIGGKHFHYFVELFNQNNVVKKVLCITDNDFKWVDDKGKLKSRSDYNKAKDPSHILTFKERFKGVENIHICTQNLGGTTFEDEFFLANMKDPEIAKIIFEKAICDTLKEFFKAREFNIDKWINDVDQINGRVKKSIDTFLTRYKEKLEEEKPKTNCENNKYYEQLIFAQIFHHYASKNKGNIALDLLTDSQLSDNDDESSKLIVPEYIKNGLEWLLK